MSFEYQPRKAPAVRFGRRNTAILGSPGRMRRTPSPDRYPSDDDFEEGAFSYGDVEDVFSDDRSPVRTEVFRRSRSPERRYSSDEDEMGMESDPEDAGSEPEYSRSPSPRRPTMAAKGGRGSRSPIVPRAPKFDIYEGRRVARDEDYEAGDYYREQGDFRWRPSYTAEDAESLREHIRGNRRVHFELLTGHVADLLLEIQEPVAALIFHLPDDMPIDEKIRYLIQLSRLPNVGGYEFRYTSVIPRLLQVLTMWAKKPNPDVVILEIPNLQLLDPEDIHLVLKAFPNLQLLEFYDYDVDHESYTGESKPSDMLPSTVKQIRKALKNAGYQGILKNENSDYGGEGRETFVFSERVNRKRRHPDDLPEEFLERHERPTITERGSSPIVERRVEPLRRPVAKRRNAI